MTCCADDIRFMGYICRFTGDFPYQQRDWVKVTVDFGFEYVKAYGEKVPVLTLREALPAKKTSLNVISPFSMTTTSPGSTSRTNWKPQLSSAQVSEATTMPYSFLPMQSGR